MTTVSVIATVRNERDSIAGLIEALLHQTRAPDEIVLVDGGSRDGTADWLELVAAVEPRLRVHREPGTTISQGRNIAIARAQGPVIAVADGGTTPARDWLERLVGPLELDPSIAVAGGFYVAGGRTFIERCISTIITPQLCEIDPGTFLPSSRSVAFRKDWWQRVGGYPEWLTHCEDLVFDLALKREGAVMKFVPSALVTWRARPSLWAFARQYFNYARGDGQALLWPGRQAARYAAYALGTGLAVGSVISWYCAAALCAGLVLHLKKPVVRLVRRPLEPTLFGRVASVTLLPLVVVVGDLAKIAGYFVGRVERWWAGGEAGLLARLRRADALLAGVADLPLSRTER